LRSKELPVGIPDITFNIKNKIIFMWGYICVYV